jgi:predicted NBD/HSP70 family sugar kinase
MNFLAFDIGGTHTKYAIVTEDGEILKKNIAPTPESYEQLLRFMANVYSEEKPSPFIGLSCPGIYDPERNQITGSSALAYLIEKDIVGDIRKLLQGVDVFIENDGNCALLGEVWKGHAQGLENAAIVVVGSAVGGGALVNGKLLRGAFLNGGEFGYMLIDNDVERESFHSFGGKSGLNGLLALARRNGYPVANGVELFEKMESDGRLARLIQKQLLYTAIGIINLQYILDPAVIIIGGAISRNPVYIEMVKRAIDQVMRKRENYKVRPRIVPAKHSNDANLLGAVYTVMERTRRRKGR